MQVIEGEMIGDVLTLRIDCGREARDLAANSKSGKTRILASTHGFVKFGDVSVSVNATIAKS
jgi:hypothetical protein